MFKTASIILSFALAATGGMSVVAPNTTNNAVNANVQTDAVATANDSATVSAQHNALLDVMTSPSASTNVKAEATAQSQAQAQAQNSQNSNGANATLNADAQVSANADATQDSLINLNIDSGLDAAVMSAIH